MPTTAHPLRPGLRAVRTQRALALVLLVCLGCLCLPALAVADGPPSTAAPSVRILMYHYIRDPATATDQMGRNLSVGPAAFDAQMRWLVEQGWQSITLDDLLAARAGAAEVPPKAVLLTFDDGYADFYANAWPILRQYGLQATIYVITGRLDTAGYMTWDQVRELDKAGVTVGAHTITHPRLPGLSDVALDGELRGSRQSLEDGLGHPVVHFAYPSGAFDPRVEAATAAAGYQTAVTTRPGAATAVLDPLALPRLRVWGGMPLPTFAQMMNGGSRPPK